MLVKINKQCRVCKDFPKNGFWPSRARRYDWLCPRCCMNKANNRRSAKHAEA